MRNYQDKIVIKSNQSIAGDGKFWWVVLGPNGKILLTSEMYETAQNSEKSAKAFGDRNYIDVFRNNESGELVLVADNV